MGLELIQIIEDDHTQAAIVERILCKARYRTNVSYDGLEGIEAVRRLRPALVILDVMLPGLDGHEVCRRLRQELATGDVPILMMSALGSSDAHRANGLDLGADDYLAKPFSGQELLARVRALLRRARPSLDPMGEETAGLAVLDHRVFVSLGGCRLELSLAEWHLLKRLAESAGRAVPAEELIALLWGQDGEIHQHELERRAAALRAKLEAATGNQACLLRLPGGSYQLNPNG